jgi:hypothetical protein
MDAFWLGLGCIACCVVGGWLLGIVVDAFGG